MSKTSFFLTVKEQVARILGVESIAKVGSEDELMTILKAVEAKEGEDDDMKSAIAKLQEDVSALMTWKAEFDEDPVDEEEDKEDETEASEPTAAEAQAIAALAASELKLKAAQKELARLKVKATDKKIPAKVTRVMEPEAPEDFDASKAGAQIKAELRNGMSISQKPWEN